MRVLTGLTALLGTAVTISARHWRSVRACAPQTRACNGSMQRNRVRRPRLRSQDLGSRTLQRLEGFLRLSDDIRRRSGRVWARYRPPTYASFQGEVYNVGLWFLQQASHVGRLVRHAAWRADRGIAVVSVLKSRRDGRRTQHHDPQYVRGRHAGLRRGPARICRTAALGGDRGDRARALAGRFALHPRLLRRRYASGLARRARCNRRSAGCASTLAGLALERPGTGQPSAVIVGPPAPSVTGGPSTQILVLPNPSTSMNRRARRGPATGCRQRRP